MELASGYIALLLLISAGRSSADGNIVQLGDCPLVAGGSCPDYRVRFFLFTRSRPHEPERVLAANISQSLFNASHPTKILMHGYNSGMSVLYTVKNEYLVRGEHNVLMLDWNELSVGPCYFTAVYNARFAGKCSAQIVRALTAVGALNIHVVGFSLGAHVAGFTANHLRPYRLPRITGLDPAMPLFVAVSDDSKLDATDARYVDVIHTNSFFQGKAARCGDVDFYMNGGVNQPGCVNESSPLGCDHHRAVSYFAESINSAAGFWGWPCGGFLQYALGLCPPWGAPAQLGEGVDCSASGWYIAKTGHESPFAIGKWTSRREEDRYLYAVDTSESCSILRAVWSRPQTSVVTL